MTTPPITCPACGAGATGRFCSVCGATLGGGPCPECSTSLSAGARFCHRCGASAVAGSAPRKPADSALPWAVAAIALVALTALVAGQQFRGSRTSADAAATAAPLTSDGVVRAPDISQLTPGQRAEALFDRIMRLSEAGQTDSVRFFAPMAIAAFQMLDPLDADQRYDLGRIGIVTGLTELARAQSDTILASNPNHLLGLSLAIATARIERDRVEERSLERRLLAAQSTEMSSNLAEYQRHRADIAEAVSAAKEAKP